MTLDIHTLYVTGLRHVYRMYKVYIVYTVNIYIYTHMMDICYTRCCRCCRCCCAQMKAEEKQKEAESCPVAQKKAAAKNAELAKKKAEREQKKAEQAKKAKAQKARRIHDFLGLENGMFDILFELATLLCVFSFWWLHLSGQVAFFTCLENEAKILNMRFFLNTFRLRCRNMFAFLNKVGF